MIYYNYPPYSGPIPKKYPKINPYINSTTYQVPSNTHSTANNPYQHARSRQSQPQVNTHSSYHSNPPQKKIDEKKEIPHQSNNDSLFEIFGIKLYFDDILLICLIFFLYNEGVQDQYLFIALILLLLS